MIRYMTHPNHGRMPVYNQKQIEVNEKNGWSLEVEKVAPVQPVKVDDVPVKVAEEPAKVDEPVSVEFTQPKKRGPKPKNQVQ